MGKAPFLIPVENQVRELDAKLLLACFAAARGRPSIIGHKGTLDAYINTFPKGIYIAKSVTERSVKILRIARKLGHANVAWDEEAIVHFPPDIYYKRRLSAEALEATDRLFAWGEDNKSLFEAYPRFPGTPVNVVGNPRIDLLRPEFREFYDDQTSAIRDRYGDFILFNTNFGSVNGYYPELNVCYPKDDAPDGLALGRGAIGLSREYALELFAYRKNNFETMRDLIPEVARAFPDRTIVVRPHPSENREFWTEFLEDYDNVHVNAEGNVVPWLLAASVLIHNSCTTGIESYILDRPAIAYVPAEGADTYGSDLPNQVSHVAPTRGDVLDMVEGATRNGGLPAQDEARSQILGGFLTAMDGSFASERIVDAAEHIDTGTHGSFVDRALGSLQARSRRLNKQIQARKDSGRYGRKFMRQRFPDLTPEVLQAKADRLKGLAGLETRLEVTQVRPDLFRVSGG